MLISTINRSYFYVFILFCILIQNTTAYCTNDSSRTLIYDTSNVPIRQPDPEKQKELLASSDYQYDRIGPAPKTWWDRFKEWFWRSVEKIFSSDGGLLGLGILQYALIIAVIIIIILLVLKNDIRSVFYGKSASVTIDFKEFNEDIHKINFDELIAASIAIKDFRKAIRLHFLKLLKDLTDHNLITWQIDKTNNDYSMELANSKYNNSFRELSLMYEYIWYGDFQLDETNFKNTLTKFQEFKVKA